MATRRNEFFAVEARVGFRFVAAATLRCDVRFVSRGSGRSSFGFVFGLLERYGFEVKKLRRLGRLEGGLKWKGRRQVSRLTALRPEREEERGLIRADDCMSMCCC